MPKLRELTKDPPLARGDAENQLEEMRDYLIKMREELEYLLTNLDQDNTGSSGLQPAITAAGILKGDGAGGVSAAVAGEDYQVPAEHTDLWTPVNATIPSNIVQRNRYVRSGSLLAICFAAVLSADLANFGTIEVCSDVAATFGVSSIITPFVVAPAFSAYSSNTQSDIVMRIQYYNNKLTLINRTGATVPATNRTVYAQLLLGV